MDATKVPMPELVERIDRALSALWRGADLSTLSRDRGYGASVQDGETVALEEDDVSMLTETLNKQVDRYVIKYVFGEDQEPLAHVRVLLTPRTWTPIDLQIDEFLISHGAPLSVHEAMLRYGRAMPQPGEDILAAAPSAGMPTASGKPRPPGLDNEDERFLRDGLQGPLAPMESGENTLYDWIQISPLGEFPHSRGIQRVNNTNGELLVKTFNSLWERLGRLFGGVPVYAGHPETDAQADRKAYGWVQQLELREDGIWARVDWTPAGLSLLQDKHYKFVSPYWIAARSASGYLEPNRLVSIALTNQPNLPVRAIGNEFNGLITPPEEKLNEPEEVTILPLAPAATTEKTGAIHTRRQELLGNTSYAAKVRELVMAKTQTGFTYDEAWELVKKEHPSFFQPI